MQRNPDYGRAVFEAVIGALIEDQYVQQPRIVDVPPEQIPGQGTPGPDDQPAPPAPV